MADAPRTNAGDGCAAKDRKVPKLAARARTDASTAPPGVRRRTTDLAAGPITNALGDRLFGHRPASGAAHRFDRAHRARWHDSGWRWPPSAPASTAKALALEGPWPSLPH